MSEVGQSIIAGLKEAVAHAKGEDTGAIMHKIKVPDNVDIKAIRKRLNLTQRAFAERYGFPLQTVRNWEQGIRRPTGAAQILLMVIDTNPEIVESVLAKAATEVLGHRCHP